MTSPARKQPLLQNLQRRENDLIDIQTDESEREEATRGCQWAPLVRSGATRKMEEDFNEEEEVIKIVFVV